MKVLFVLFGTFVCWFCGCYGHDSIVFSSLKDDSRYHLFRIFSVDKYILFFYFNRDVNDPDLIHLTVVACGADRVEETMVMFKSAILFSEKHIHLHVFADDENRPTFVKEVQYFTSLILVFSEMNTRISKDV